MKVIKFKAPDGEYTLPLIKVAENRAQYYADKENFKAEDKEWDDEIDYVMNDNFEGIDWLINNTDFEDWKEFSTKINNDVKVLEDSFWCDSDDFEIIELK